MRNLVLGDHGYLSRPTAIYSLLHGHTVAVLHNLAKSR